MLRARRRTRRLLFSNGSIKRIVTCPPITSIHRFRSCRVTTIFLSRASRDFISFRHEIAMLANFFIILYYYARASLRRPKFASPMYRHSSAIVSRPIQSIGSHPNGIRASISRDRVAELANSPNSPRIALKHVTRGNSIRGDGGRSLVFKRPDGN
jgi:hypothetical protein